MINELDTREWEKVFYVAGDVSRYDVKRVVACKEYDDRWSGIFELNDGSYYWIWLVKAFDCFEDSSIYNGQAKTFKELLTQLPADMLKHLNLEVVDSSLVRALVPYGELMRMIRTFEDEIGCPPELIDRLRELIRIKQ